MIIDLPNEAKPAFKTFNFPPNPTVSFPPLETSSATLRISSLASSIPNWSTKPPKPNLSKAFLTPPIKAPPRPKALLIFSSSDNLSFAAIKRFLYKPSFPVNTPFISVKACSSSFVKPTVFFLLVNTSLVVTKLARSALIFSLIPVSCFLFNLFIPS